MVFQFSKSNQSCNVYHYYYRTMPGFKTKKQMSKHDDERSMHQAFLDETLLHFMQGRLRKLVEQQKMPEARSILPNKT